MTADTLITAIQTLIEDASSDAYPLLDGLPIYVSQEDENREYPCITVADSGAEEHEVLRGVFDPLTDDVTLNSIPHEDSADGTTEEQHRAITSNLYNLLADVVTIDALNNFDNIKVFDIRGNEPANSREEGRNTALITMEIVCCQDN